MAKEKDKKKSEENFVLETIKYMLENKPAMDANERREKYGMAYDCEMIMEGDLVAIIVDNPLPDDDMAVLITSREKVIDSLLGKIGSKFMNESKDVRFFEG